VAKNIGFKKEQKNMKSTACLKMQSFPLKNPLNLNQFQNVSNLVTI